MEGLRLVWQPQISYQNAQPEANASWVTDTYMTKQILSHWVPYFIDSTSTIILERDVGNWKEKWVEKAQVRHR